jgi:thiol-disulfide isomerase/thioredoxin
MAVKMSRKIWIIVAIVVVAVGTTVGVTLSDSPDNPPDSTFSIITWNETSLSTLEGTPVVLNFWSISCGWCRYQLPFLETVAQQREGEIEIVAINMVDSAANIQKFFADYEPAMTIALDSNMEVFRDYCLAYNNTRGATPFTLFVDSEGGVQYAKLGAFASEAELWDTLSDVLGITAPETS